MKWSILCISGHASLVGIQTGKILDFDVRNKKCSICQYYNGRNETIPNHSCNSNWRGNSFILQVQLYSNVHNQLN